MSAQGLRNMCLGPESVLGREMEESLQGAWAFSARGAVSTEPRARLGAKPSSGTRPLWTLSNSFLSWSLCPCSARWQQDEIRCSLRAAQWVARSGCWRIRKCPHSLTGTYAERAQCVQVKLQEGPLHVGRGVPVVRRRGGVAGAVGATPRKEFVLGRVPCGLA